MKRWRDFEKEYKGKELPPLVEEKSDFEWYLAANEYKDAKEAYDKAKKWLDEAKERLIKLADGKKVRGDGVEVIPVTSTRYDYAKAKQYIPEEVLEQIKKEVTSYRIKVIEDA